MGLVHRAQVRSWVPLPQGLVHVLLAALRHTVGPQ